MSRIASKMLLVGSEIIFFYSLPRSMHNYNDIFVLLQLVKVSLFIIFFFAEIYTNCANQRYKKFMFEISYF